MQLDSSSRESQKAGEAERLNAELRDVPPEDFKDQSEGHELSRILGEADLGGGKDDDLFLTLRTKKNHDILLHQDEQGSPEEHVSTVVDGFNIPI
jgi:hypothetical protein